MKVPGPVFRVSGRKTEDSKPATGDRRRGAGKVSGSLGRRANSEPCWAFAQQTIADVSAVGETFGNRSERLKRIKFKAGDWWFWLRSRNPPKVAMNFLICSFSMACPFPEIKNPLLRLTGMKVGENAFIAMGAALDIFYPELIEIGENAVIGYGCVITAHEMVNAGHGWELRTGNVTIGANSTIGTKSVVLPGTKIGKGAKVSAMSLVNSDVPPNAFYGGVPARGIR